jgi:putative ABC transport system permease protein
MADPKKAIFPQTWNVDEDYIKTLGMKMAAGRSFSNQMLSDSNALVINETAAKFLGMGNPVNKIIYKSSGGANPTFKPYTIIGVVKDFNFSSLRENISPVIMQLGNDEGGLSIRVSTANLPALISQIQNHWSQLTPAHLQYSFMNQDFDAIYRSEQRTGTISLAFTSLAIIIACLGLFGLAAYAAEQRTKEIGIRKVLGASVANISAMLSKDFIKLVLIAIVIALPFAWWGMSYWLQSFAYRSVFHWWILALAGCAAIIIALITISFQSIKAAFANPVKSLRSE